ncbi:MAG: hypothetical protein WD844_15380 [Thermoleophilaceae bacterium]
MKLRKPSPAMVVALIALVMATTGSAVAAVSFARNAGAVDGKSAVSAAASLSDARGNVVAAARGGSRSGQIPGKFLAEVARAEPFAVVIESPDNAASSPVELLSQGDTANVARLSASCEDRNNAAGIENPDATIALTNTSGETINLTRRVGTGDGTFDFLADGAVDGFRIGGQNTFIHRVQLAGTQLLVDGVARQEGNGTAAGACVVYGTLLLVR